MFVTMARITLALLLITVTILPVHGNWYGKRGDKDDLYNAILQAAQASSRRQLTDTITPVDFETESAIESVLRMARQQQESKFIESKRS